MPDPQPFLLRLLRACACSLVLAGVLAAQDGGDSPHAAAQAFLEAARRGDFAAASRQLDLSGTGETEGESLARQLKIVLDRTLWVELDSLSEDPAGDLEDGLPAERERLGTITSRSGKVELFLRRTAGVDGALAWRIAPATVARIPALYAEFGDGVLGEVLPRRFFVTFLDVQLWQWLGLLILCVLAGVLSWLSTWCLYRLLRRIAARTSSTLDDALLELSVRPLRFGIALLYFTLGTVALRLALPVQEFLRSLERGLAVVVVGWLLAALVDMGAAALRARLVREGKVSAVAVLPLGEKTLKVLVLVLATTALFQSLGFNVTGVLAGLGVGGLALALAAQKTIENLFGGLSLILDQPVRVGDFCRFGERVGTVEDVGLRTTKIRTLERTLVSVPNSDFAHMALENFARRDKVLFKTRLGLRYETSPDQMRWVLAEIRRLLLAHPRVEADPARVRFVACGDYSLDLEVFAFVSTTDFGEFLEIQEDLLLRILDIVSDAGTGFAFPSSTTYLAEDAGNDAERTRLAEERGRAWRAQRGSPFSAAAHDSKGELAGRRE